MHMDPTTSFADLYALARAKPGAAPAGLESVHVRKDSAEFHYYVVSSELRRDSPDVAHTVSHLVELLVMDPGHRHWLTLATELAEAHDESTLLPEREGEGRYFATEALRAWLWSREGRLDEAVQRWCAVQRARDDVRFLHLWGAGALEPDGAIESLDPDTGLRALGTVLGQTPEARYATTRRLALSRRWGRLALRFGARHPDRSETAMLVPGLLRKAGMFDEALAALGRSPAADSWHGHTARGLILRERGDHDAAAASFERALAHDPDDLAARLEAGDGYVRGRRWDRALAWYQQVLDRDPEHAWAWPSTLWCRYMQDEDGDEQLGALLALERQGNHRASGLLDRLRDWGGHLPEPSDASANTLRAVLADPDIDTGRGTSMTIGMSDVEGPSNFVAFRHAGIDVDVSFANVATPDPRLPIAEVAHVLWALDDGVLRPAVPPPADDVARAVTEIAAAPYDRMLCWAAASAAAAAVPEAPIEAWLACVVHPPTAPGDDGPLEWIPRVQLAATDVIAHLGAASETERPDGWERSERRAALLSVLHGPMDWAVNAAILSLTAAARAEPIIALDVHKAFTRLRDAAPDSGSVPWAETLLHAWTGMAHLSDHEREAIEHSLERWLAEDEDDEGDDEDDEDDDGA